MRLVYSKTLREHFEQPRHVGRLDPEAADVGTGSAGTQETGGVLRLQIQADAAGQIKAACFKAYGPPALIAAGSWLAATIQGLNLEAAAGLSHQPIAAALELAPVQLHCAMLAEDALHAAIRNYKDKQGVNA